MFGEFFCTICFLSENHVYFYNSSVSSIYSQHSLYRPFSREPSSFYIVLPTLVVSEQALFYYKYTNDN